MVFWPLTRKNLTRVVLLAALTLGACSNGYVEVRYEVIAQDSESWTKVIDGIKIKSAIVSETPNSFMGKSIRCNPANGVAYSEIRDISLAPPGSLIFQVKIRNDIMHVATLSSSEITLFDPKGNRYSVMDRTMLKLNFLADHPCQDSLKLDLQYAGLKLVDNDFKILPGRANKGYIVFKPDDAKMPGEWSISFFDLSVNSKAPVGGGLKTLTHKFVLNKYADVYTKTDWFGTSFNKTTKDLTAGGTGTEALHDVLDTRAADEAAAEKAAGEKIAAEVAAKAAAEAAVKASAVRETALIAAKAAAAKAASRVAAMKAAEADAAKKDAAVNAAIKAATDADKKAKDKEARLKKAADKEAVKARKANEWNKLK